MSDTMPGGQADPEEPSVSAAETVPTEEATAAESVTTEEATAAQAVATEGAMAAPTVATEEETAPAARTYEPAAPGPLGVPRTPTGNAEVDAALERLADVDHLATDGHIEVYEDVHQGLRSTLTALDARQGPPAPAAPTGPYNNRS